MYHSSTDLCVKGLIDCLLKIEIYKSIHVVGVQPVIKTIQLEHVNSNARRGNSVCLEFSKVRGVRGVKN